jgi:predicted DNA-binding transcriptional regulator
MEISTDSGRVRRYTLLCEDRSARRIEELAREYDTTQEAILRRLVSAGLEDLD